MNNKQFSIYNSSAGTGKTYTLVLSYLSIIIKSPEKYQRILAITFTKAAANEMKERIIEHLGDISSKNPDYSSNSWQMLDQILQDTGVSREDAISRARLALQLILHNYSSFAVGTIDSFVHKIVRAFAYDLNLPMSFEVELDSNEMLTKAVDQLISKAPADKELTKILEKFSADNLDNEKNWNIEDEIITFANLLLREEGDEQRKAIRDFSPNRILKTITDAKKKIEIIENSFKKEALEVLDIFKNAQLSTSDFYQGKSSIIPWFQRISMGDYSKINGNSYTAKMIDGGKWFSGKATAAAKSSIENIKDDITQKFLTLQEKIKAKIGVITITKLAISKSYPLALLNELDRCMNQIREESNMVHISEFNKRIATIVQNDPVPFIYERMGEQYKHFLVDEFQDTSVMQWLNLLPLITNALSEGFDGDSKAVNKSMVVGDAKQAIYRFRNGDVDQFIALPELTSATSETQKEQEKTLLNNHQKFELDTNFRSGKNIVDFNSAFFPFAASVIPSPYCDIYNKLKSQKAKNDGGYIYVEFFVKEDERENQILEKVKEIIKECQEDGFSLNDIAIMCRSNKHASQTAVYLLENKINVVSSESLLLSSSKAVKFLTSIIQLFSNPNNEILRLEIIDFLCRNYPQKTESLSNEILKKIETKESIFIEYLNSFSEKFSWKSCENLALLNLTDQLIYAFDLSKNSPVYIRFFRDAILEAVSSKTLSLPKFGDWWNEKKSKLSVIIPEGINAVKVMTIHKSKGLAFPVVINPFAQQTVKVDNHPRWVNLEEEEVEGLPATILPFNKTLEQTRFAEKFIQESTKDHLDLLNLVYVTFTRPRERLYILTNEPAKSNKTLKEMKSIPNMLASYFLEQTQSSEIESVYTIGEREKYESKTEQTNQFLSSLGPANPKDSKIAVSHLAPKYWEIGEPQKRRNHGLLVHQLLTNISNISSVKSRVLQAIEEGILPAKEADVYLEKLLSILNHPQLSKYFDGTKTVLDERDILLPNGHSLRPDKVVLEEKKATIIDYKTGEFHKKHETQINSYGNALKDMGYEIKKKLLIYITDDLNIKEVE